VPPLGAFVKHGIAGLLLAGLLWVVHEVVATIGGKVDALSAKVEALARETDVVADAVYDSCDAKRPPRVP